MREKSINLLSPPISYSTLDLFILIFNSIFHKIHFLLLYPFKMKYTVLAVVSLFASPLLATPVEVESGKAIAMIPQVTQDNQLNRRSCPAGYGLCASGGCCPTNGRCCSNGGCCNPGYQCWISHLGYPGCCPIGIVCKYTNDFVY